MIYLFLDCKNGHWVKGNIQLKDISRLNQDWQGWIVGYYTRRQPKQKYVEILELWKSFKMMHLFPGSWMVEMQFHIFVWALA